MAVLLDGTFLLATLSSLACAPHLHGPDGCSGMEGREGAKGAKRVHQLPPQRVFGDVMTLLLTFHYPKFVTWPHLTTGKTWK